MPNRGRGRGGRGRGGYGGRSGRGGRGHFGHKDPVDNTTAIAKFTALDNEDFMGVTKSLPIGNPETIGQLDDMFKQLKSREVDGALLSAPTGTGKSIGVPPFALVYLGKIPDGNIWVSQPTILAARMLASSFKTMIGIPNVPGLGASFEAGGKSSTTEHSRIKYGTAGHFSRILLGIIRDIMEGNEPKVPIPDLIFVDEAHMQNSEIVELCGAISILKKTVKPDKMPYIIACSATLNSEAIKGYFTSFKTWTDVRIDVERKYKLTVEQVYVKSYKDGLGKAIDILKRKNEYIKTPGTSIIVVASVQDANELGYNLGKMYRDKTVIVATSQMSDDEKDELTALTMDDQAIVVATDVIETSLTINGAVLMINVAWSMRSTKKGLKQTRTSEAQDQQRHGRVGRVCDGVAVCIWDGPSFEEFVPNTFFDDPRTTLLCVTSYLGKYMNPLENFNDEAGMKFTNDHKIVSEMVDIGVFDNSDERITATEIGIMASQFPIDLDDSMTILSLINDDTTGLNLCELLFSIFWISMIPEWGTFISMPKAMWADKEKKLTGHRAIAKALKEHIGVSGGGADKRNFDDLAFLNDLTFSFVKSMIDFLATEHNGRVNNGTLPWLIKKWGTVINDNHSEEIVGGNAFVNSRKFSNTITVFGKLLHKLDSVRPDIGIIMNMKSMLRSLPHNLGKTVGYLGIGAMGIIAMHQTKLRLDLVGKVFAKHRPMAMCNAVRSVNGIKYTIDHVDYSHDSIRSWTTIRNSGQKVLVFNFHTLKFGFKTVYSASMVIELPKGPEPRPLEEV
jgi:hypothetical protein